MSLAGPPKTYGLVVSVNCDLPTKALHPVAIRASKLLKKSGLIVQELFDEKASATPLFVALKEIEAAGDKVAVIFFVAHGSGQALIGNDGHAMFIKEMSPLLNGAAIIANSCFKTDELAKGSTRKAAAKPSAAVLIGYSPVLQVVIDESKLTAKVKKLFGFPKSLDEMLDCTLTPLQIMLLTGMSAKHAMDGAWHAWTVAVMRWKERDLTTAGALNLNRKALTSWGDEKHRLSLKSTT